MTNYRINIKVFTINSVYNWLQPFIGVWVLIWTLYLNYTQISAILAISLLVGTLLELPTGALADLIGRKKTVIIGRLCNIAAYLVFIFARDFWGFLIGQILYQANWAFESGAQSALLYDSLKENGQDKKYYKAVETNTFFLSTVFLGLVNAFGGLMFAVHPHFPFVIGLITSVISLAYCFFFQEPKLDSQKFSWKAYLSQNLEGAKHIFRHPKVRAISIYSFVISFITFTGLWYIYEPRLAEGNFSPNTLSVLVAGTYAIRALGTKLIPYLDQHLKPHQIPLFMIILQVIGSLISFFPGRISAIATVYSRKFLDGIRYPILATLQNQHFDSRYRATALSAISLFTNLLVAAAGPAIGYGLDHLGAGITLGVFGIIGIILGLPAARQLALQTRKQN